MSVELNKWRPGEHSVACLKRIWTNSCMMKKIHLSSCRFFYLCFFLKTVFTWLFYFNDNTSKASYIQQQKTGQMLLQRRCLCAMFLSLLIIMGVRLAWVEREDSLVWVETENSLVMSQQKQSGIQREKSITEILNINLSMAG